MNEYFYDKEKNQYYKKSEIQKNKTTLKKMNLFEGILENEINMKKFALFTPPKMEEKEIPGGKFYYPNSQDVLCSDGLSLYGMNLDNEIIFEYHHSSPIINIFEKNEEFYIGYEDGVVYLKNQNGINLYRKYKKNTTLFDLVKKDQDLFIGSSNSFYKNDRKIKTKSDILSIEISNDNNLIYFGQRNGKILIFKKDEIKSEIGIEKKGINIIKNILDYYLIVGCYGNYLGLFDIRKEKEIYSFENYKNDFTKYKILNFKNHSILSGQDDHIVRSWNIFSNGRLKNEIQFPEKIYNIFEKDHDIFYSSLNKLYH